MEDLECGMEDLECGERFLRGKHGRRHFIFSDFSIATAGHQMVRVLAHFQHRHVITPRKLHGQVILPVGHGIPVEAGAVGRAHNHSFVKADHAQQTSSALPPRGQRVGPRVASQSSTHGPCPCRRQSTDGAGKCSRTRRTAWESQRGARRRRARTRSGDSRGLGCRRGGPGRRRMRRSAPRTRATRRLWWWRGGRSAPRCSWWTHRGARQGFSAVLFAWCPRDERCLEKTKFQTKKLRTSCP